MVLFSPLFLLGLQFLCLTYFFTSVFYFDIERWYFDNWKSLFVSCVRKMGPSNIFLRTGPANPDMFPYLIGPRITLDRNFTLFPAVIQTNEDLSDGLRERMHD